MNAKKHYPRLLIAGTHSGVGKTTITLGMLYAFVRRGLTVQPFKVGPDFIDPGHHHQAAGRPSHNLDSWMMIRDTVPELFEHAARGTDLSIIEGVMGLYDGITGRSESGSTAELAKRLRCPVVLVVDASAMARSLAALLQGYKEFDPGVNLVGVIANHVSGPGHFEYLKEAVEQHTTIRLLGYLPPSREIEIPERHLGLHTALESISPQLSEQVADLMEKTVDLNAVLDLAQRADPLPEYNAILFGQEASGPQKDLTVAYAWDKAFSFYYHVNLELLEDQGCRLIPFSALQDQELPQAIDLLYLGGGYPELYAAELSENRTMLESIRRFARAGGAIYAECGGLMVLSEGILSQEGQCLPMVGLLPARVEMTPRPTLRYVEVIFEQDCLLGPAGMQMRGHEFHYSRWNSPHRLPHLYRVQDARGVHQPPDGVQSGGVLASYTHLHLASHSQAVRCWVDRLRMRREGNAR